MGIVEEAVAVLRRDGLIVYPTETVYGLGADALSEYAVERVYETKGRPLSQPMSVAVCDTEMLHAIALVEEWQEAFIERFLPGPVTVVLPAKSCLPSTLSGGAGQIGIRIPDNATALAVIGAFDAPITATSANLSGKTAPTRPDEVTVVYDLLIDEGTLPGTPSTVVDLTTCQVLRAGRLTEDVARFIGQKRT
ncbi:MAG: L-threonylcarbamoyladenylate synthase [Methanomicrobiaceae archaeon]|nr:L-threonylcarbamoyladenylate synthase [Methanomicrobiaceae archaeon]